MSEPNPGKPGAVPVFVYWVPALLVMATIWALSSVQLPVGALRYVPLRDKGAHFLAYGALGFFVAHAAKRTWHGTHLLRVGLLAVWITLGWGLIDELHQAFVPGRFPDLLDLVADGLGAVGGTAARLALSPLFRRVSPRTSP